MDNIIPERDLTKMSTQELLKLKQDLTKEILSTKTRDVWNRVISNYVFLTFPEDEMNLVWMDGELLAVDLELLRQQPGRSRMTMEILQTAIKTIRGKAEEELEMINTAFKEQIRNKEY